jgi:dihydrolipoamide dehydrogenase
MSSYDVVVIGAGPGGYVAAIRAAQLGLKTALVEKDSRLGGTCLLRGCIPTKSLLHSADLLDELRHAKDYGVLAAEVSFDFALVQKARQKVVDKSAAGVAYLMKQNRVEVHTGVGCLRDGHTIEVTSPSGKTQLSAKNIIVATGSVPKAIPSAPIDGKHILTSNEILEIDAPPKSLLVLGAGAVGVEFASAFNRFGSDCTVVEMLDRLLPIEDAELGAELQKSFRKRGITTMLSTKLEKAVVKDGGVEVAVVGPEGTQTLQVDVVLVAIGRAPVTAGLGLEQAGIRIDKQGYVEVDGLMQTGADGIYAIGDVVRTPALAHVASAEAIVAVEHLAGRPVRPINYLHTPSATYCDPEVASVGLSESDAKAKGYAVKIGRFPFSALAKARILGKSEGWVKIVSDSRYGEILGVHIIGPHATDLIAEAVVALRLECTTEELAHTMHAHPTLPEAIMEAAHGAVDKPIHL